MIVRRNIVKLDSQLNMKVNITACILTRALVQLRSRESQGMNVSISSIEILRIQSSGKQPMMMLGVELTMKVTPTVMKGKEMHNIKTISIN